MARIKGTTTFAADFEVEKRGPLDAKNRVETMADLTLLSTWQAHDGNEYTYPGMVVAVYNDGTNNNLYRLNDADYTDINNWVVVGAAPAPEEENWVAKFQVTADFEANEVIDLTNGNGATAGTCNTFGDNIDGVDKVLGTSAGAFFADNAMSIYILGQGQMYKSVGIMFDSPTSCHFPVPLQVGDFFWIEKDAGMGTVSQGFASAESMTYAEAKVLKDAGNLVPGSWYKITDFVSQNGASIEGDIYTATAPEPLFLQATSPNGFAQRVYSELYFNDIIKYNFDDTIIPGGEFDGERDTGSDTGGDITISNVTATSFECNMQMIVGDNFELEVEDDNGDSLYSYGTGGLGTDFTITALSGGRCRIDILVTIDMTTPAYNYIYINGTTKAGDRDGNIIFRRDENINGEASFDFRNHGTMRWKADVSGYSAWDSGTTYDYRDVVLHGGHLYIAMEETTGETPAQNSRIWMCAIYNYDTSYCCTQYGFYMAGVVISRDETAGLMYETLGVYDEATETSTHDLIGIKNFSILSEDVVVNTKNYSNAVDGLKIGSNCSKITILGRAIDFTVLENSNSVLVNLYAQLVQNVSLGTLASIVFSNYVSQNVFYAFQSSIIGNTTYCTIEQSVSTLMLNNGYTSKIGAHSSNLRLGSLWKATLGTGSNGSYLRRVRESTLAQVSNVKSYTDGFEFNSFGIYMQNLIITNGTNFKNNTFLDHFGGFNTSSTQTIDFSFQNNDGGSWVFQNGGSYASYFNGCTIGGGVRHIHLTGSCRNTTFDKEGRYFNGGSISNCRLGKFVNGLTFGSLDDSDIGDGVTSLDFGSTQGVRAITVRNVGGFSVGATAQGQLNTYETKRMFRGASNTKWLRYTDNLGVDTTIDATV